MRRMLEDQRPEQLLLVFGNVDLHVHFLYQLITKEEPLGVDDWARLVWDKYHAWLEADVVPRLGVELHDVFLAAAVLPTVSDDHLAASVTAYTGVQTVPSTLPAVSERARLVQTYNSFVAGFCASHPRVHYIDLNDALSSPPSPSALFPSGPLPPAVRPTGRPVDPSPAPDVPVHHAFLVPHDRTNIHPSWERSLPLWLAALTSVRRDGQQVVKLTERHVRVDLENRERNWLRKGRQTTHVRAKDIRKKERRKRREPECGDEGETRIA